MELTWKLKALGWETFVSPTARAYAGPMVTIHALWAQRRKWDEGMIRLLLQSGINGATAYPWRMQLKMAVDMASRLLFMALLTVGLSTGSYRWNWIWIFPPAVAVLLNWRTTRKVPHRKLTDMVFAVTLIPVEIYLWFRLTIWTVSWLTVVAGIRRDGWARQYKAEKALVVAR
jgi:cellulose synthase/poly-beta-1,6-N-acetylglucosamine synthase-like glycosyltransferase